MILSNLSTILGKKKLKISKVITDTGVSRPTLTSLYYNTSKGINFYTLNVLCNYLEIQPSDLLKFYPIDISNISITYTGYEYEYIDVDEEHDNSIEKIGIANFEGVIRFMQTHMPVYNFQGYLEFSHADTYNLSLKFLCDRKDYFAIGDDTVLEYIDECIYNALTENFPENRYCEIGDICFTFNDTYPRTHSDG